MVLGDYYDKAAKTIISKKEKNSISIQPKQNMWKCISKQYGQLAKERKKLK